MVCIHPVTNITVLTNVRNHTWIKIIKVVLVGVCNINRNQKAPYSFELIEYSTVTLNDKGSYIDDV